MAGYSVAWAALQGRVVNLIAAIDNGCHTNARKSVPMLIESGRTGMERRGD